MTGALPVAEMTIEIGAATRIPAPRRGGVGVQTGDAMIAIRGPTAVTEERTTSTVEAEVIREMFGTAGTVKPHETVTTDGRGVEGVTISPWQVYHFISHAHSVALTAA